MTTIKIWNAFASNNSGSYVIVGRFPTDELAADVAAELLEACRAHTAWRAALPDDGSPPADGAPSPLAALAARHAIVRPDAVIADERWGDNWPQYSSMPHPEAFAIGRQVFVHSDYTVTMPALLGHVMYARGGRVETEIDHAHDPIVTTFSINIPWKDRNNVDIPARMRAIVDEVRARDGLQTFRIPDPPKFGEPDLVITGVYPELATYYASVRDIAAAHGAVVHITLAEGVTTPG